MKKTALVACILIVLSQAVVAADADAQEPTTTQRSLMELGFRVYREPVEAPEFTLKNLDGESVSLSDMKGSYVFLNFWATWCPPCREEMPSMDTMYHELSDIDFEVLAVDLQESEQTVRTFVESNKYTFPVLLDSRGRVGSQYNVRSIPTTYLIDDEGFAVAFLVGSRLWDTEEVYEVMRALAGE